jgi:hypothetical protein
MRVIGKRQKGHLISLLVQLVQQPAWRHVNDHNDVNIVFHAVVLEAEAAEEEEEEPTFRSSARHAESEKAAGGPLDHAIESCIGPGVRCFMAALMYTIHETRKLELRKYTWCQSNKLDAQS